jgi:hypothetical protein
MNFLAGAAGYEEHDDLHIRGRFGAGDSERSP